tara:strand:+ start:120 stop:1652 length:1533 start_codon:yes stop_codon:yes gene_type:complete
MVKSQKKKIKVIQLKKKPKTEKAKPVLKRYNIDISSNLKKKLTTSKNDGLNLYIKKLIKPENSKSKEESVSWDFYELKNNIKKKISPKLYGWYLEDTSSAGTSTFDAIKAYKDFKFEPNYLNPNKNFSFENSITLHSKDLGMNQYKIKCPFFTAPYGSASSYGGQSNELSTMEGSIQGDGIYTCASFSTYSVEQMSSFIKKESKEPNPFYMYQLYLTGDNDINISLIERIKASDVPILIVTIDTGGNAHGGIGLLENQSDLTYSYNFTGNLRADPVFNIKCYEKYKCVGTKDKTVLAEVSKYLKIPISTVLSSYDLSKAFDYAKVVQGEGMGNLYMSNNAKDTLCLKNIVNIAHSKNSISKYVNRNFKKGIPIVFKGCISIPVALNIQKSGADGVYVSNHGGRFIYNSIPPLDILTDIKNAVKKNDSKFGVWFDGGIRYGSDIVTAYCRGAEFVGLGRPIIYACVLYGKEGVSATTKKFRFELETQCKICGINNFSLKEQMKGILFRENN